MDLSTLVFLIMPILGCLLAIINYNYNISFDPTMIGLTLLGILLFYKAPNYSKSSSFYYVCSLILGCLGSILVIFFVLGRFVPKRFAYATLIFGSSTIGFFYQLCKDRIYQQIIDYGTYIIWYTVIAAFVTFAFAYRYGPPTHPKTLNLVQWTCQILSLALILLSNPLPSVGLSLVGVLIFHYNFSNLWERLLSRYKRTEPRALLTEDEYYVQGLLTTQEELKKLREYCRSPDIDPWKVVNKLRTPDRFAKFMVTGEDVGEEERSMYDTSCFDDSEEMIEDMDTTGGDTLPGSQDNSFSHENSSRPETLTARENSFRLEKTGRIENSFFPDISPRSDTSFRTEISPSQRPETPILNEPSYHRPPTPHRPESSIPSQIHLQSTSYNFAFRPLYRMQPYILDQPDTDMHDEDVNMDQEFGFKKMDSLSFNQIDK